MSQEILPGTADRLAEWTTQQEVVGVILVGSRSRGHADALSDDDLEVLLTPEAFARRTPSECSELRIEGEGDGRRLIYDAQYTLLADLERKARTPFDLDHWPYERARVLFERDERVSRAVAAAGAMEAAFRSARLRHATIDTWTATGRAKKTFRRDAEGAGRLLVARGATALARILFALEWRWVPLAHWIEAELRTLDDPTGAGPLLVAALRDGRPEPLAEALDGLEERLCEEGVPRREGRLDLFLECIHPGRAEERARHGLQ